MSTADTRTLIDQAVRRFVTEVPALAQLKLVIRLELATHGDAPIWRVEVPGPQIRKDPAGDARLDITVQRPVFNALAEEGSLRAWADAYSKGSVRVTGDGGVVKLLGSVIEKRLARTGA